MDTLQIIAIFIAFVATGASQFVDVKKNVKTGNFCKDLTNWGKVLGIAFIVSIFFAVIFGYLTNEEKNENKNTLSSMVDSMKNERKLSKFKDSAQLAASVNLLGSSYVSIWLYPPIDHITNEDSITFKNRLLDFTKSVLGELKYEFDNPLLLKDKDLYLFWNSVKDVVSRAQLTLYGYDFTSLQKVNNILQLVGTKLRDMSENYGKESFFQEQKIDTNLYPIINYAGDSAWVQ